MTIDALPLGEVKLEIPIKGIPTHDGDLHLANHKVDTVQKLVDEQEWKVDTQDGRRCTRGDRERSEHDSYYNGTEWQHEKGAQTHHLRNRKYIMEIIC